VTTEEVSLPIAWRLYCRKSGPRIKSAGKRRGSGGDFLPNQAADRSRTDSKSGRRGGSGGAGVGRMPLMAMTRNFARASASLICCIPLACEDPRQCGPRESTAASENQARWDVQRNICAGTKTISLFRPSNWQNHCRPEMENGLTWREGSKKKLRSRFAAVRVRPAHRDFERSEPHPEQWLLIEWPNGESEPTKYWFSTEAADTPLRELVKLAKHRWNYRTRLRGAETGTGTGPLRRARLARISSSRHAMYRRLRLPRCGKKSFFPLCTRRSTGTTHRETSVPV